MPLDRHARRFLEMLAAAGQSQVAAMTMWKSAARALTNLAEMVDPPGTEPRSAACAST